MSKLLQLLPVLVDFSYIFIPQGFILFLELVHLLFQEPNLIFILFDLPLQQFQPVLKLCQFILQFYSIVIFTVTTQARLPGLFLEIDLPFDELFFVSFNLSIQICDSLLLPLRLALKLFLLLILEVEHQATSVVRSSFGHEILFQPFVLVAQINDVQTQVLIIFFESFDFLLEEDEISLEGDKLNFQVSFCL